MPPLGRGAGPVYDGMPDLTLEQWKYVCEHAHFRALGLVGKYGLTACDVPDITQDLCLHVWRRRVKYDPGRAAWSTFVTQICRNRILNFVEFQHATMRAWWQTVPLPPDTSEWNGAPEVPPPSALVIDVREVIENLPVRLQRTARKIMAGKEAKAKDAEKLKAALTVKRLAHYV